MLNKENARKIADKLDVNLSDDADAILLKIKERNGLCPCRIDGTRCPCKFMKEELNSTGKCHCGLFVREN